MIETFAHKGLEAFHLDGATWGIQAKHASRLGRILDHLEAARDVKDMDAPGVGPHPRRGGRKAILPSRHREAGRLPLRGRPRIRSELS